jgi:5-methylcytosine-specific restriction endonuclease McrA
MHQCRVCGESFTNKRIMNKHERTCQKMEIDSITTPTKRRRKIPAAVRFALWNATFGEHQGSGTCQCCKRVVTQQAFEAGHIVAVSRGGSDSISNLRVICALCNRSMGNTNMDEFMARHA